MLHLTTDQLYTDHSDTGATDQLHTDHSDTGTDQLHTDHSGIGSTPLDIEKSWHAAASFVCGLIACIFNGLLFTAPLGFILGTFALIFALIGWSTNKNSLPGLILGGLSFLILFIYLTSIFVVLNADPTISF